MNQADYVKSIEDEKMSEGKAGIYLAGPIDHSYENPDERHDALARVLEEHYPTPGDRPTIYCPFCIQSVLQSGAQVALGRNMHAIEQSDGLIAVWRGPVEQPSFGTPTELMQAAAQMPDKTIVVGTMGTGLIAEALRSRGVREVGSLDIAVRLLRL